MIGRSAPPGGGWRRGQSGIAAIASLKAFVSQKAATFDLGGGSGSGGVSTDRKSGLSSENSPIVHGWHGVPSSIL